MPVDSLSVAAGVLSWAATYFVHSTVLLGGAWIVLRCRHSPGHSFRESLWKTAIVGGIVTTTAQMMLPSGRPSANFTFAIDDFGPQAIARSSMEIGDSESVARTANFDMPEHVAAGGMIDLAEGERTDAEVVFLFNASNARIPGGVQNDVAREPGSLWRSARDEAKSIPAGAVLAFLVCAGLLAVTLGVTRCMWQTLSLRRKLSRCLPISAGPVRRLLDELCRHIPRTPEVLLFSDPADPEPAAFGIRRWVIVLPERAAEDLPEDELRALLAHELAHLVRGDAGWLYLSRIICSCLAFQPLNHLARREWQRAAEFLCDEWAVSRTGARLALARCLAEVAGWRLSGRPSTALLAATGRKSSLADRIERLVVSDVDEAWNDLRGRRRMLVAGVVALALLAWCAPRVHLAVAAPDPARASNHLPERAGLNQQDTGSETGTRSGGFTDTAKRQASGGSTPVLDDAPSAAPPTSSTGAGRHTPNPQSGDLATLLESLDRELSALESELRDLEPLLRQGKVSPAVYNLADRIHIEIKLLVHRRNALRARWKKIIP
jgi:beta-lactamase regulating signal transducer with metallopeptidase domain